MSKKESSSCILIKDDIFTKLSKVLSKYSNIMLGLTLFVFLLMVIKLSKLSGDLAFYKDINTKLTLEVEDLVKDRKNNIEIIDKLDSEKKELEKEYERVIKERDQFKRRAAVQASRGATFNVPQGSSHFKSYMELNKITSRTSPQYKFINKHRKEGTLYYDENGMYKIGDHYLVALGSAFGKVGDKYEVELSSGSKFKVVKAEFKSDAHTDSTNSYHTSDGSVIEFLVSEKNLNRTIKRDGGAHNMEGFKGKVVKMTKLK